MPNPIMVPGPKPQIPGQGNKWAQRQPMELIGAPSKARNSQFFFATPPG